MVVSEKAGKLGFYVGQVERIESKTYERHWEFSPSRKKLVKNTNKRTSHLDLMSDDRVFKLAIIGREKGSLIGRPIRRLAGISGLEMPKP